MAINGESWKYEISLVLDDGVKRTVSQDELLSKINADTEILQMYQRKCSFLEVQLTSLMLYHVFDVFQTKDGYYWTVEKDYEGIIIQRFRKQVDADYKITGSFRGSPVSYKVPENCKKSLRQLIDYLYKEEINKQYHYISSNSQQFANGVFYYCVGDISLGSTLLNGATYAAGTIQPISYITSSLSYWFRT